MNIEARLFPIAYGRLKNAMLDSGRKVATETWQGVNVKGRADAETTELMHVTVRLDLRGIRDVEHWRREITPNLPWADDHFAERVSGQPLNPPPSWAWWPWAGSAAKFRADAKFNHTYPERYWPKYANDEGPHRGIRSLYGDLNDVVALLTQQPHTRQAYLPIFFPEDTGTGDGGRKPCTLGYQFIQREGRLDCYYPMRSCDLIRHFPDDVYLTVRLMLWVLEQCKWDHVKPGQLVMHMTSLHCFANDMIALRKERDA